MTDIKIINMEEMTHEEKNKLIKDLRTKIEGSDADIEIFIEILDKENILDKYYDDNGDFLPGKVHELSDYKFKKLQQSLQQWVESKTDKIKEAIRKNGMYYAEYTGFNKDFKKMGHTCPYEYCIESQEITEEETEILCPVFGHNCPGGEKQVKACEHLNKNE